MSTEELQTIENLVGVACLVAGEDLVDVFTQFVFQLKGYGVMYSRSMTDIQKEHFIGNVEKGLPVDYASSWLAQSKYDHNKTPKEDPDFYFMSLDEVVQSMRTDLDVVEGVIMNNIETFVSIGYDEFHMIKDPNKV